MVDFVLDGVALVVHMRRPWRRTLGMAMLASFISGCADQVRLPTPEQLAVFEQAAPAAPTVDMDRIRQAQLYTGPYRVVRGDVLEFTMPALLGAVTAAQARTAQGQGERDHPYLCRVGNAGSITLPAVGEVTEIAGLTLADIEEKVVKAYEDQVVLRPSVFVRVREYHTAKVYIAGAVEKPGVYSLRADQMTLVSLLTEAGGISEAGAAMVRILRSPNPETGPNTGGEDHSAVSEDAPARAPEPVPGPHTTIVLPVVGMNIPFRDVSLDAGDTVVVEQIEMPLFTVIGLVNKPGNYEYPPTARYNLVQALAFAGGLDLISEPRYATIYRLAPEGSILRIPFQLIQDDEFTEAIYTAIRPGDVVAIEHTPRTRMNAMLRNMVRFNTGLYITGRDLWDQD